MNRKLSRLAASGIMGFALSQEASPLLPRLPGRCLNRAFRWTMLPSRPISIRKCMPASTLPRMQSLSAIPLKYRMTGPTQD